MRVREVRFPLLAMAVVGTISLNSQVVAPLLARITFHSGPGLFAAFGAAGAFGALVGSLVAARATHSTVSLIGTAALAFGIVYSLVAFAPWAWLAMVGLAVSFFWASIYIAWSNARLQQVTDDAYRGRVMALYSIVFLGSTPIGSIIVSAISEVTNPRVAVLVGGLAAAGTGLVALARVRRHRRADRQRATHRNLKGSMKPMSNGEAATSKTRRIGIIGAGPGGICMAIKLREAGIETFTVFERAPAVGGTWFHNTYPGCACDVPSALYSFSFELKRDWSRPYGTQPEIRAYFEHCVTKYGLAPHLRLDDGVRAVRWDDERAVWHLTTERGEEHEFDVVVGAVGHVRQSRVARHPGARPVRGHRVPLGASGTTTTTSPASAWR